MKGELLAVGLTAILLTSLVTFASPSTAVEMELTGPDVVTNDEEATFNATVGMSEDVTVENYTLEVITTKTNKSVNVTFAPNGTILAFDPATGVVGNHGIDVDALNETLNITRLDEPPTVRSKSGYGNAQVMQTEGDFGFRIEFHTSAFVPGGVYALQLHATTTDGKRFSSNVKEFEVIREDDG